MKKIKKFWGYLVEIGVKEFGLAGHFDIWKSYTERMYPLKLQEMSKTLKKIEDKVDAVIKDEFRVGIKRDYLVSMVDETRKLRDQYDEDLKTLEDELNSLPK